MRVLKLISWNIWFDRFEQVARWNEISKICVNLYPDVICFQEVTFEFLNYLKSKSFITDNYDSSDSKYSGDTFDGWYGNIILTKKDLQASFLFYPFPTSMERKLLMAKIPVDEDVVQSNSIKSSSSSFLGMNKKKSEPTNLKNISIATVHLESLNNQRLREKQLDVCAQYLKQSSSNILCGDFNFCSYRNFNSHQHDLDNDCLQKIIPYMIDLWPILHDTAIEKGYTFDSTTNTMIHQNERMRYDRILYNSNTDDLNNNNNSSSSSSSNSGNSSSSSSSGNSSSSSSSSSSRINNASTINNSNILIKPLSIQLIGIESIQQDNMTTATNNQVDLNLTSALQNIPKKSKKTDSTTHTTTTTAATTSTTTTNPDPSISPSCIENKSIGTSSSNLVYTTPTKATKNTTSAATSARDIFPSDHFGLFAQFNIQS